MPQYRYYVNEKGQKVRVTINRYGQGVHAVVVPKRGGRTRTGKSLAQRRRRIR